jgi:hypothetical protein
MNNNNKNNNKNTTLTTILADDSQNSVIDADDELYLSEKEKGRVYFNKNHNFKTPQLTVTAQIHAVD